MILDLFQPQQLYDSVVPYPGIQNLNNYKCALTCAILIDVSGEKGTWKCLFAKTVGIRDHEKSELVFSMFRAFLVPPAVASPSSTSKVGRTPGLLFLSLCILFQVFAIS